MYINVKDGDEYAQNMAKVKEIQPTYISNKQILEICMFQNFETTPPNVFRQLNYSENDELTFGASKM